MTTIASKEQFERMLTAEQAVLFVFFDWSGQAMASLRLFESWIQEWRALHPEAPVSFYRLNPDRHLDTWSLLGEQARRQANSEGGFGSVTWLHRGRSVAVCALCGAGRQGWVVTFD
jgi:hypothetical protein